MRPPKRLAGAIQDADVEAISNDQVEWRVHGSKGKIDALPEPDFNFIDHCPCVRVYDRYYANPSAVVGILLEDLDDPQKFVAAHFLLEHFSPGRLNRTQWTYGKNGYYLALNGCPAVAQMEFDGMTVLHRVEWGMEQAAGDAFHAKSYELERIEQQQTYIDPAQRGELRLRWRKRLDQPTASVSYLIGTIWVFAPALLWAAVVATRVALIRRRIRRGVCRVCGYDLRMSTNICPECGTSVLAPVRNRRSTHLGLSMAAVAIGSGIVLGWAAHRWLYTPETAPARPATARWIAGAIREHSEFTASRERLIRISNAIDVFKAHHMGIGPKSLEELVLLHQLPPEDLHCPRTGFQYVYTPFIADGHPDLCIVFEEPIGENPDQMFCINALTEGGRFDLWFGEDAKRAVEFLRAK